jgi:hypothetical protein
MKQATAELKACSWLEGALMDLRGVGPVVAARVLADIRGPGSVRRPEPVRALDRNRPAGCVLR